MPDFAPYQVNLAARDSGKTERIRSRESPGESAAARSIVASGVQILSRLYRESGEKEKADTLQIGYRTAMGYKR